MKHLSKRGAVSSPLHGQTANAGGIVVEVFRRCHCQRAVSYCALGLSKTQKQPVPYWHDTLRMPSAILKELSLHCYVILSAFIITLFSFTLLMFSLLAAPLDKCVYGISHVCKPLHKALSKINKRRAERGGREVGRAKNEGQERKIQSESHTSCWKGP